jgi:hypothetical protein
VTQTKHPASAVKIDGVPVTFILNPVFRKNNDLSELDTDLLVIEQHAHKYLGGGPKAIDTILGGALTAALSQSEFTGELGQTLLIPLPERQVRNLLLIGAGDTSLQGGRSVLCATFGLVLETARNLKAKRISLPMFPGGLDRAGMSGTMAILQCRLRQFERQNGGLGGIEEIEILSTPQAKRWLSEGLSAAKLLCATCSNPQLHTKSL